MTDDGTTLLRELAEDPWGEVSPSVYDTGRLVSLAPWLPGHAARLDYLGRAQRSDGGWGEPDGYALVPTLSATEALIACLRRGSAPHLVEPARRGLAALHAWLEPFSAAVPDTIAVEVVLPCLVAAINTHLDAEPDAHWAVPFRLPLPRGFHAGAARALRAKVEFSGPEPQTWWASLEALGSGPFGRVRPVNGAVACSPAATAAWLDGAAPFGSGPAAAAYSFLNRLQARYGGPVPGVTPITVFERAWVLAGIEGTAPPFVLDGLAGALGPGGAPAAAGLPPDCDDGAVALTALRRHGWDRSPECLLDYHTGAYFTCFPGERTASTSTNAHAVEALYGHLAAHPADRPRYLPPAAAAVGWLLDVQDADGCWWDKWHASPYYATACAVAVLAGPPVDRAVRWVLATQRADGSWGRWGGTVEETAYAVLVLARARAIDVRPALAAGVAYLRGNDGSGEQRGLWHAKDLYAPGRVIRAARLGALNAAAAASGPAGAGAAWPPPAPRSAPDRRAPAGTGAAATRG